jgi:hypothetical protein
LLLENFGRKKDANGVERRTILIELTNPSRSFLRSTNFPAEPRPPALENLLTKSIKSLQTRVFALTWNAAKSFLTPSSIKTNGWEHGKSRVFIERGTALPFHDTMNGVSTVDRFFSVCGIFDSHGRCRIYCWAHF